MIRSVFQCLFIRLGTLLQAGPQVSAPNSHGHYPPFSSTLGRRENASWLCALNLDKASPVADRAAGHEPFAMNPVVVWASLWRVMQSCPLNLQDPSPEFPAAPVVALWGSGGGRGWMMEKWMAFLSSFRISLQVTQWIGSLSQGPPEQFCSPFLTFNFFLQVYRMWCNKVLLYVNIFILNVWFFFSQMLNLKADRARHHTEGLKIFLWKSFQYFTWNPRKLIMNFRVDLCQGTTFVPACFVSEYLRAASC